MKKDGIETRGECQQRDKGGVGRAEGSPAPLSITAAWDVCFLSFLDRPPQAITHHPSPLHHCWTPSVSRSRKHSGCLPGQGSGLGTLIPKECAASCPRTPEHHVLTRTGHWFEWGRREWVGTGTEMAAEAVLEGVT